MGVVFQQNGMKVEDKGESLCITIDKSSRLGLSGSGKNNLVASTKGNINVGGITLGLNAYVPAGE